MTKKQNFTCPFCQSTHLQKWTSKKGQKIKDIPVDGRPGIITIDRKRYRCFDCKKTFLEPLEWLHLKHMMTKTLVEYIKAEYQTRSAASIAREVGIDPKTVKFVVAEQTLDI